MTTTPQPSTQPSDQLIEQEKAAAENTREGYGSTLKSRLISGKPDTDTGGPGANNEQGQSPQSEAPPTAVKKPS